MKISNLPKTLMGKWSCYLAIAFIMAILLLFSDTVFNLITLPNIFVVILSIISITCGVGCFVIALISIIKSRERSILVFLVGLVGFLATILFLAIFIGETFFPQ
jgi:hypothetical protein